jgi:hypothetical protein
LTRRQAGGITQFVTNVKTPPGFPVDEDIAMRPLLGCLVGMVALIFAVGAADRPGDDDDGDEIIERIMKRNFKGDDALISKVTAGDATDAQKRKLIDALTTLSKARPPRGGAKSWKEKTGAMLDAARDVLAGKEGARNRLEEASDCKACHKRHKGD